MKRLGAVVLLRFSVLAACAADYHVAPQGDDAHPGTSPDRPLRTLGRAAALAGPGDTVLVRGGVYREAVGPFRRGEPGRPVTFKAADGERATLTGADVITGWRKATAADVGGGHPHLDRLFVAEVDWLNPRLVAAGRLRLLERGVRLRVARTPDAGWWGITKGLSLASFTDDANLVQRDPEAWKDWTAAILEQAGGSVVHIEVAAFDPATHTLTLARNYSTDRTTIDEKRDRYYMENHPAALDGPGQFVYRRLPGSAVRLIVWPSGPGADGLPMIEAPRRNNLFYIVKATHLVLDGFEVCFSDGHGIGMGSAGDPNHLTIQNCYVHDNDEGYGIEMRSPVNGTVRRNVILRNGCGIVTGGSRDCVIEENDIGWNYGDGIDAPNGTRNLLIRRNYIHDHYLWGHPDNVQFWTDVEGVTLRDNVMVNAGQTMMSDGMRNTRLINNVWLGSRAVAMICGGDGWEITGNTVCATAPMPTGFSGKRFAVRGNIFAPLHGIPLYGMIDLATFSADYNLAWAGRDYAGTLFVQGAWKGTAATVEQHRSKFGQEAHGLVADPKFRNAAAFFAVTDYGRIQDCTASTLVFRGDEAKRFAAKDHVELDFDGVPRHVVATGANSITVAPPLAAPPLTIQSVANWGATTNFAWDLRLADDSPARGAGVGGADMGCSLDIQAFRRGDFDGDGRRDLRWPANEADTPAAGPGREGD